MAITRRQLLGAGAAAAACGVAARVLPGARAGAERGPGKRLLLVYAYGGWDTTYALDPKEAPFATEPTGDGGAVRRFGELDILCDPARPSVTRFFERHGAVTALVRGISTGNLAHQHCSRRICTGTRVETNPDLGAIAAHELGRDLPLPYLILGERAFTGPFAGSAARLGASHQLVQLMRPPEPQLLGDVARRPVPTAGEQEAMRRYALASAERARATRGATGHNRRSVDDFAASIERADRLRAIGDRFGAGGALDLRGQIDVALDALAQDVAYAVMTDPGLPLDTHYDNSTQHGMQETLFGDLTLLIDRMLARPGRTAGRTMLDDTVVAVFSEMTRSPIVEGGGKAHWPVAAALVIGGGARGGRVYGATTPTSEPVPVDLATATPSPAGTRLQTSNFAATVLALCGVDPDPYLDGAPAIDALVG